jgi:tRNA U34 2-thiouridine synthase MnmA/TrmU
MNNWDSSDEAGTAVCNAEKHKSDAARVAAQLNVPLHEVR